MANIHHIKIKLKNGETLTVRSAEKKDAIAVIAHVKKVIAETDFLTRGEGEFKMTKSEEEKIFAKYKKSANSLFLVALLNDQVVGISNVSGVDRPRLRHIVDLGITVRKTHWGKNIGTILMKTMIDWAKASRVVRKINLKVQTNNKAAIALYKKFGFKKEGLIKRDMFLHGKFYDDYCMGLLIDPTR